MFFLDVQNKIDQYAERYCKKPRIAALHLMLWSLKEVVRYSGTIYFRRKKNCKGLRVLFKLTGGYGDIVIAFNFLQNFYRAVTSDNSNSVIIDILVSRKMYEGIKVFAREQDFVNGLLCNVDRNVDYDLYCSFSRVPVVVSYKKDRLLLNSFVSKWFDLVYKFDSENPIYLRPGSVGDRLLMQYSIFCGHNRLQQGDIGDLIGVTSIYTIKGLNYTKEMLQKFGITEDGYIVLCGQASATYDNVHEMRDWPTENYVDLIYCMKKYYPKYKYVQIGVASDSRIDGCDIDLRGKTTFEEMLYLIKAAKLLIAAETGPVHFRHFINGKTSVVLFGPTNKDFLGYPENINVHKGLCHDCEKVCVTNKYFCLRGNGSKALCMLALTPEIVMNEIVKAGIL